MQRVKPASEKSQLEKSQLENATSANVAREKSHAENAQPLDTRFGQLKQRKVGIGFHAAR